jgi:hypothetical protein
MQITRDEETRVKEQDVQQYLTFMIAGEEYAISLLKVKELIEYDTVTPVPKTPEWVRGVINLRGSVVPVIDLAVKFRLPASVAGRLTCISSPKSSAAEKQPSWVLWRTRYDRSSISNPRTSNTRQLLAHASKWTTCTEWRVPARSSP